MDPNGQINLKNNNILFKNYYFIYFILYIKFNIIIFFYISNDTVLLADFLRL